VHVVTICRMCEIAAALELIVITSFKRLVNPVTNPNPVCSNSLSGSQDGVVWTHVNTNESQDSIKCWQVLQQLHSCWLLRKISAAGS
jgi:hypothetical protein